MAKLKEFLRQLGVVTELRNTDFEAMLGASGIADIEIPDSAADHINGKLFTEASALNNPKIISAARKAEKGLFMDLVDKALKPIIQSFPKEVQEAVNKEEDTLTKIGILKTSLPELSKQASTKEGEKARQMEEELRGQITKLENDAKAQSDKYKVDLRNFKSDTILKSKIFGYNIDKPLQGIKQTIANGVIQNLLSKYKVELNADESDVVLFQKADGELKDVYENNVKLTLETALTREMDPYIVKNNNGAEGGAGGNTPPAGGQQNHQTPVAQQTLADMRAKAFG